MDAGQSSLTIREYPFGSWFVGAGMALAGLFIFSRMPGTPIMGILFLGGGAAFLLFSTTLTVTADHMTQTLTLRYRAPFWGSKKEIPFSQVTEVKMQMSHTHSDGGPTYRIVVVCVDGKVIPFHSYYTNVTLGMRRKADRLRAYLGVGGTDETPMNLFREGMQMAKEQLTQQQEALTGSEAEEHVTDGIHWRVQTLALGGSPITRWFSPDLKSPGGFLLLTQKVAGQKNIAGGLMNGLGEMLFKQTAKMYGWGPEDLPGMDTAAVMQPLDAALEPHFTAFTSDQTAARSMLNPWACAPLADWAQRYPLKAIQTQKIFSQLMVLISPQGLYVASLGTMIPEALEEMTNLGVALVKAQ